MSNDGPGDARDPRFTTWIVATTVLFLGAVAVGFIWLPSAQPGLGAVNLWDVICSAVGVPYGGARSVAPAGAQPVSNIAWTPATRSLMRQGNTGRGAALATTCNGCHGVNGISADAAFPNLAGQNVAAMYKQLEDFQSGKRNAMVMGVFVSTLSPQDMLDLATHYASLPNPVVGAAVASGVANPVAQHLIEVGSPLRNIAPCAACHGPAGKVIGAPGLQGQQRAYLEQELQAFAAGVRHNDISEQMRSVARQLTGVEIASLADYYSAYTKP